MYVYITVHTSTKYCSSTASSILNMEFTKFQSVTAILFIVLLPLVAATKGDGFPYNPFFNSSNICEQVECGRGTCESSSSNYSFNFRCNCEDGWRRTRLDDDDEGRLEYLPCIVPNCTLDYSCMPAAPPAPSPQHNMSAAFDPCNWIYCGEGTCTLNSTNTHSHSCQCRPGYSNLLNITAFPCYNDCAIGSESCQRLGIRQASSTTNPSIGESNHGTPVSIMKFNWMAVLLLSTSILFFSST